MDENWFMQTFASVPYMTGLLERVRRSGELSVVDKRTRGELHVSDAACRQRDRKENGQNFGSAVTGKTLKIVVDAKVQPYKGTESLSERGAARDANLMNV